MLRQLVRGGPRRPFSALTHRSRPDLIRLRVGSRDGGSVRQGYAGEILISRNAVSRERDAELQRDGDYKVMCNRFRIADDPLSICILLEARDAVVVRRLANFYFRLE